MMTFEELVKLITSRKNREHGSKLVLKSSNAQLEKLPVKLGTAELDAGQKRAAG